ncbi:MAG: ATP-binding cassette domain-containing protein, partial [Butyrivibrio sp.]|nr:ATP-binding cassette domain-containing protein [Butyrivibrio sp.]
MISANNVTLRVGKKALFEDVNIKFTPGNCYGIIGANGAGKSTLFNAISGNFYVDTGSIVLDGEDITYLPEYKRAVNIGRLYQDPMRGTAPGMSIEENLTLAAGKGGWLSRISNEQRAEFREILRSLNMGLEDRLKQPMGLLSGGQR